MEIQRSSTLKNQMKRYAIGPNSGCIIRPNGDIRLDCMAPFIIGNVLEDDFKKVWIEKGINAWKNPKVRSFIDEIVNDNNSSIRNHVDNDISL